MTKIKIEIKARFTAKVLFTYEIEDNTIKLTLIEAVKTKIDLSCADLSHRYTYPTLTYPALTYPTLTYPRLPIRR